MPNNINVPTKHWELTKEVPPLPSKRDIKSRKEAIIGIVHTLHPSVLRTFLGATLVLGIALALLLGLKPSHAQPPGSLPTFEWDESWPKPLPNNLTWGGADSVWVDKRDHAWILTRPMGVHQAELDAGLIPVPPVVELDKEGNFVQGWGGPSAEYDWPVQVIADYPIGTPQEHGIYVDCKDNVWVTGNGHVLLKFTRNGEFLLQIGRLGQTGGSNHTELLGNPTDMAVDCKSNEVFVSDGYLNRRVIVFDASTGEYKRRWGAYGNVPNDGPPELYQPDQPLPEQFFIAHGIQLSEDGLLHVSDRQRNRVQVFEKDGTFVDEVVVDPNAPAGAGITVQGPFTNPSVAAAGFGSVTRVAFSGDPHQQYLYAASLRGQLHILRRSDLEILGTFTPNPGGLHHIATDKKGNLYISDGRSPRRFLVCHPGSGTGDPNNCHYGPPGKQ